jgi:hypothetical protein
LLDIAGDEEGQFTYWLLVFPETIVLDNIIFLGDPAQIEQGVVKMQTTEEKKDFCGAIVFWQVGEKHGGRRIQEKMQSSISNLFN